jgi:SAM-dependent methyltransferase
MKKLLQLIPKSLRRILKLFIYKTVHYGTERYCPVCGKKLKVFRQFSVAQIPPSTKNQKKHTQRKDALCWFCGSLERHRLLWLFLQRKTSLFGKSDTKLLHIAAESCFESKLRNLLGKNYLTADLYNPKADIKMDISDIKYSNESFDVIICNHVLEHVEDDIKAMREFYRVLKKGGWAILLAPIAEGKTFEDALIVLPEERARIFGQYDHVRKYGEDYIDRLRSVGFNVNVYKAEDIANNDEITKMGLKEDAAKWGFKETEIYYCVK